MSLLNISCPICSEVFNNADDVYSTSCGHLFHLVCLRDWEGRSTSCPQCRHHNPASHKLYLSFDESDDVLNDLEAMKEKLKSSNERIIELQVQNSELELNFMKMQEQYTQADVTRRLLEKSIQQMRDSEDNFMQLQGQYTESSELVKSLEDRIEELSLDNECKIKELELAVLENASLKNAGQNGSQSVPLDSILEQKLKILEHKFKNISQQLEQEIDKNIKLTIEKMKLESFVKNMKPAMDTINKTSANESNASRPNRKDNNRQRKENKTPSLPLSRPQGELRNKSIRIKDLPHHLIVHPLECIIINLAAQFKMTLCDNDLLNVYFLDATETKLFAEFRSCELKEKFLAKKVMLKRDPLMSGMKIREFMQEDVYELYKYAKEKLQKARLNCIFVANNKVFAKAYNNQNSVREIKSKQQVDNLLKPSAAAAEALEKANDNGPTIDEYLYQIS